MKRKSQKRELRSHHQIEKRLVSFNCDQHNENEQQEHIEEGARHKKKLSGRKRSIQIIIVHKLKT